MPARGRVFVRVPRAVATACRERKPNIAHRALRQMDRDAVRDTVRHSLSGKFKSAIRAKVQTAMARRLNDLQDKATTMAHVDSVNRENLF